MAIAAVVFDFDGTLARPALDFSQMQQNIAEIASRHAGRQVVPGGLAALEWIDEVAAGLGGARGAGFAAEAHALVEAMELEAASRTSLFGFARPLLRALQSRGVRSGVITRNIRACVQMVFPDATEFVGVVLTREDVPQVKPDPGHLLAALEALGVKPGRALMVGDHPQDVLTARRAGALAAAVASGGVDAAKLGLAEPDFLEPDAWALWGRLVREGWLG